MNLISHVVSFRYERRIRPPARFQREFIAMATLIRSATADVRGRELARPVVRQMPTKRPDKGAQ